MKNQVRPARLEDAPTIRTLIREAGINPSGLDWRRFVLAVDAQQHVIGCGQIKPHKDGSLELASIAVTPAWQGHGAARELIETLLERQPGVLYLTCRAGLEPFYRKFGFKVIQPAEMPAYFKTIDRISRILTRLKLLGETVLVMQREAQTQGRQTEV